MAAVQAILGPLRSYPRQAMHDLRAVVLELAVLAFVNVALGAAGVLLAGVL